MVARALISLLLLATIGLVYADTEDVPFGSPATAANLTIPDYPCFATLQDPTSFEEDEMAQCYWYRYNTCCDLKSIGVVSANIESLFTGCNPPGAWCRDQISLFMCHLCSPQAHRKAAVMKNLCPHFAVDIYSACALEQISWGEPATCLKFVDVFPSTKAFANAFNFELSVNNDGCFNSAESLLHSSVWLLVAVQGLIIAALL